MPASGLIHGRRLLLFLSLTMAGVMLVNAGAGGAEATPPGGQHGSSGAAAGRPPGQRWGSAAGQGHLVGKPGNTVVPQSTRGRYPQKPLSQLAPKGRNQASVAAAPAGRVRGFDKSTGREVPAGRNAFERVYTKADGTQTTEFSAAPVNFQRPDGSWQPIDARLGADGAGWRNAADAVDLRVAPRASLRIFGRAASGQIMTQRQDATGAFPGVWAPVGTFQAAGPPAAILDPVLGRTAVVARGTDVFRNVNDTTRVYEQRQDPGISASLRRTQSDFAAHSLPVPPGD